MTHSSAQVQIASEDRPSNPPWFAEVAIVAQVFLTSGVLKNIEEQVRFARARFGIYELVDFIAVLIGYAVSAEPSLQAFYERLQPFAEAFMALFGRKHLPHRYLAALDQPTVEALRALFLEDLVVRTAQTFPAFRIVGSSGAPLAGRRCGWDQTSSTTTSTARAFLSSCSSSPLCPSLCSRLSRTQAGRSRSDPNNHTTSPLASLVRHRRWLGQWELLHGISTGL